MLLHFLMHVLVGIVFHRREGQDTQDELEKRDLREELEDRERRHFSSKGKSRPGIIAFLYTI